jgi:hypothetical protein
MPDCANCDKLRDAIVSEQSACALKLKSLAEANAELRSEVVAAAVESGRLVAELSAARQDADLQHAQAQDGYRQERQEKEEGK